jgi:predicted metal-binding membrane protein
MQGITSGDDEQTRQPGRAWRLVDRRTTALIVLPLFALGAVGWYLTARQAGDMNGMLTGLGQVGTRMPNDMAAPAFLAMWVWMMVAMMFPAIGPVVLAHRKVVGSRNEGALPTVGFVAGYLLAWTVIGLVPLAAFLAFRNLPMTAADGPALRLLAGSALVVAGVYQFTPLKNTCLRACRSPLGFVMTHDFGTGATGAFRAGVSHGAYCVGCCWALMSLLVIVGLMNLSWMVALAVIFFAEKNWRYGVVLTKVAGVSIICLGVAVAAVPSLLPQISGGG